MTWPVTKIIFPTHQPFQNFFSPNHLFVKLSFSFVKIVDSELYGILHSLATSHFLSNVTLLVISLFFKWITALLWGIRNLCLFLVRIENKLSLCSRPSTCSFNHVLHMLLRFGCLHVFSILILRYPSYFDYYFYIESIVQEFLFYYCNIQTFLRVWKNTLKEQSMDKFLSLRQTLKPFILRLPFSRSCVRPFSIVC